MLLTSVQRRSVLTAIASTLLVSGAAAEDVAAVRKYTSPDGVAHQAVLLKGRAGLGDASRIHVVLVDTSASQVGEHRLHALGVLEAFLGALPDGDRVRLVAVDVAAESLTTDFVPPRGEAIRLATDKLKDRIPLGATDLPAAVAAARDMLPGDQPGSIVYIGDGISSADIISPAEFQSMVQQLRSRRIAVHSYGVGPQLNLHLLGMFAHQTGGAVHFDSRVDSRWNPNQKRIDPNGSSDQNVAMRGARLAEAVRQPIFRPAQIELPANVEVAPRAALPLRADRETIYLVRGALPAEATISVRGTKDGMAWKLAAPIEGPNEAFLASMFDRIDREGELANSFAGATLMTVAQDEFAGRVTGMVNYGKLAFQQKDFDRVQKVVEAVRRIDPANRELAAVERAARKLQARTAGLTQQDKSKEERDEAAGADDDLDPLTRPDPDANLLDDEQRAIRIRTQRLKQQVNDVMNVVRRLEDPQTGIDELDRTINIVRSAIDIEPEIRQQLEKQLRSERLAQINRREIQDQVRIRAAERRAQNESKERLAEQLMLDEQRLEFLIDRVRALMEEGHHGDDAAYGLAEEVAVTAWQLRPNVATTAAAYFGAEAAQQLRRSFRLRAKRADQFLETLHQVELSHIPFPDEPPVRFPPASVWAALTERRKKWANVDLKRNRPKEERIRQALDETTEVSFVDTSLRDALDYIEDLHNFDIIILEKEITDEGASADVQINLELSGIMLRSALKLMLEPHDLTYVIRDEVMKITTIAKADENLETRVYPVADLVIPIMSGIGGGMGGMGGGMGGMGVMGNPFGGGMGGMGMGGMGMGGMGMGMGGFGGGFFSVPAENLPLKKKR
jgi:hypothetical protein